MKHNRTHYWDFISSKSHWAHGDGFEPADLPSWLFPFQERLVRTALRRGRFAIFADCGLGKTPMQLSWASQVVKKTGKPVLILTPPAVAHQTVKEGIKFDVECHISRDGVAKSPITVTNYQQIHKFDRDAFGGVVCDESSILKNYDGATKDAITAFMKPSKYRLLCSATPSPNDFIELGTSSEALGYLGFVDMVNRFFKKVGATSRRADEFRCGNYVFRGHAEGPFWKWVCSWAIAIRSPSDLGFYNNGFKLPDLIKRQYIVSAREPRPDMLFDLPAVSLLEQRQERRRTIQERCEKAADLISKSQSTSVAWCYLNSEGVTLSKMIPEAVEVSGNDSEEKKEEALAAFSDGQIKTLVSKPTIAGYGMNWQHCNHQTFFPSHSFEQWYQAIRRSWRYGQKNPVTVDMITSEGESYVLKNLERKEDQAEQMHAALVKMIGKQSDITETDNCNINTIIPLWLKNKQ